MCGLLYINGFDNDFTDSQIADALSLQAWRGPDAQEIKYIDKEIMMGHVRLSIIDTGVRSNQPMQSHSGDHEIIFNGEIYNHLELRKKFNLNCNTDSDTQTILEGFSAIGHKIFDELDGMFSIIIYERSTQRTWAVRDRYGIKPLFEYRSKKSTIYSSENVSINHLVSSEIDKESIEEWRLIRRPALGKTFFKDISEVNPGDVICDGKVIHQMKKFNKINNNFVQDEVSKLLRNSISAHELSDVTNVGLLSGGIDSSIICKESSCKKLYTVGSKENNEFFAAQETADKIDKNLTKVILTDDDLRKAWKELILLKGEPLNLPNEALIFMVCKKMKKTEKVVLTGEGADELFFGYYNIFRYCSEIGTIELDDFLGMYGYSSIKRCTPRLRRQLEKLMQNKSPIEFCEDFFLQYHLPTLLRRMDFSSMAASKEARVPFVTKKLMDYVYRADVEKKINDTESKIPLRKMILDLGLENVLTRKKIGFSATQQGDNKDNEYEKFQDFNLEVLGW